MADIKIRVEGRKATNLTPEVKLVTWNEGYEAEFEFDDSWKASELKTALFITKGQTIRKPFTGNKCEVPMLVGVEILRVGVESNDILGLKTTVAAVVECELSARDLSGEEVEAPTPSVYDELIELINAGMVKGEQGEKGDKGDKGDAGAIKFIPVTRTDNENPIDDLPKENIDTSAIYLLPIDEKDEQNRFTEYAYINGKWEILGAISIQVDHSEYVKFTDYATGNKAGVVKIDAEKGFIVDANGVAGLYQASLFDIDQKRNLYKPITPFRLDYAVKAGITTNTETWTDEDKAAACETIGAMPNSTPSQRNYGDGKLVGFTESGVLTYSSVLGGSGGQANLLRYTIPLRDVDGVLHGLTPTTDTGLIPKKYADDNFVAKFTNPDNNANRRYVLYSYQNGTEDVIQYSSSAKEFAIAQFTSGGNLVVAEPRSETHAATKKYVDDAIGEIDTVLDSVIALQNSFIGGNV